MSFIINSYRFAAPAYQFILDDYSDNGVAGYSLRKLKSTYTGFACRVRRTSDNALADVNFDADNRVSGTSTVTGSGIIAGTTLSSWLGSNNGTINILYAQTGSQNFNASATAAEPLIWNAGTLVEVNGRTAMYFDGGDQLNTAARVSNFSSSMYIEVMQPISTNTSASLQGNFNTNSQYLGFWQSGSTLINIKSSAGTPSFFKNNSSSFAGTTRDNLYNYLTITNGSLQIISVTGWNSSATLGWARSAKGALGAQQAPFYNGYLSEMLFWSTASSDSIRSSIVTDINNYYGAY